MLTGGSQKNITLRILRPTPPPAQKKEEIKGMDPPEKRRKKGKRMSEPFTIYRSLQALRVQNPPKNIKKVSLGLPVRNVQKVSTIVKNSDGTAIRNANSGDSRESIRRKKPNFHVLGIRANRLKPVIRNIWPPRSAIRKKGVQFVNPEAIRENQAIRANLQT